MNKRTEMIKRLNSIYQIFRWKSFGIKLLLLVGLLAFTQKAEAGRDTWSDADRYFYATFDDSKGCIVIYVRQGDNDFGPAGENGYVENATIKVNGQEIIKMSASDAGNSGYQSNAVGAGECEDNSLSASGFTNETGVGSGGSCNYRRFRWYPNQTLTGKVNVSISGTWDVNGAYHYDNMSATREITIPGIGGIEYKNTVLKTTSEGDTITILTFTKTINSNLDTKDQYELLDANGDRVTSATCVSSSDRKTVTVTIPTIEEYSKHDSKRMYSFII